MNSKDLIAYNSAKNIWEANSLNNNDKVLLKAQIYLKNVPTLVGKGPSVAIILDLHSSILKGCKGDFNKIFGVDYSENMKLEELAPFIHPTHSDLMAKHFPAYMTHIIALDLEARSRVDLSVIFKYKRTENYQWLSFRAFKYFSDTPGNLGYVILEYTDITDVKNDKCAKFIVYDKDAGYIVNDIIFPNSSLLSQLTPTEIIISKLIAKGMSDKEIAPLKGITINTVKQHKKHIFSKLGINKSTELVAIAYDCGIVS